MEGGRSGRYLLVGGGIVLLALRLVLKRRQLPRADPRARLLAAALEQTGDLIVIARADGSIEHANGAFQRAVGFSVRELSLVRFPQPIAPEVASLEEEIPAELRARGVWRASCAAAGATAPPSPRRARSWRSAERMAARSRTSCGRAGCDRRAAASRSAGAQRAAVGGGRAGRRRGPRDQQPAAGDRRLRRVDDRRPGRAADAAGPRDRPARGGARRSHRPQPAVVCPAQRPGPDRRRPQSDRQAAAELRDTTWRSKHHAASCSARPSRCRCWWIGRRFSRSS